MSDVREIEGPWSGWTRGGLVDRDDHVEGDVEWIVADVHSTLKNAMVRGMQVRVVFCTGYKFRGWVANLTPTRFEMRNNMGAVIGGELEALDDAWIEPRETGL